MMAQYAIRAAVGSEYLTAQGNEVTP